MGYFVIVLLQRSIALTWREGSGTLMTQRATLGHFILSSYQKR
jgi:hypothetical protein